MRLDRSPLMLAVALAGGRTPAPLSAQLVRYEVSLAASSAHLFHVKAEFPTGGKDTLYVSLPAWSPGNYVIQNYARYVRHFGALGPTGLPLEWDRFDKDTWRVVTGKQDRVTVARGGHFPAGTAVNRIRTPRLR